MDDITQEFLVESYESLDQLDSDFVALEETPNDRDRLASIFRTVHTIKGTSGFLAFPKLEKVAHVGENLLVPLRDGDLSLDQDIADALLGMVDAIRSILSNIESDGSEGEGDFGDLIKTLEELKLNESKLAENNEKSNPAAAAPAPPLAAPASTAPVSAEGGQPTASNEAPISESATTPSSELNSQAEADIPPQQEAVPPAVLLPEDAESSAGKTSEDKADSGDKNGSLADSTVRINVRLLDTLMNQVGELVLARNQILQFSSESNDAAMMAASQRLNLITTELQEGVMKTRMQPIRNAWNKLPRVVRDLSASCKKKVEVEMEGAETELDKTILEAIKDPLTHIVRNSVDHGIEAPEIRKEVGKPETGTLLLRAYHESGQVNIEISDDGGGLNTERIKAKALEKGVVSESEVAQMSEHELTNLILLPGFSTAAKVTNVSGRGVGMDVVKTNIERIGGTLEIQSELGKGTTLRIKIPLTLAIVPALIVTTGGENYAIPQVSLLELVRLDASRAGDAIEYIHDSPVYRLRGKLLPLIYLDEQLKLCPKRKRTCPDESINIVVLQAEDRQFGLVVESINDTQEIVVKPLGQHLKNITAYAGSTIMGDGTVALILDTAGIAKRASVLTQNRESTLNDIRSEIGGKSKNTTSLLIVNPGDDTQAAVQLSTVARLEEFTLPQIEHSATGPVVQYRDAILPLVSLCLGATPEQLLSTRENAERLQTVVFTTGETSIGILVGQILDIVEGDLQNFESQNKTSVIQGKVTQLVDLDQWVARNCPHLTMA